MEVIFPVEDLLNSSSKRYGCKNSSVNGMCIFGPANSCKTSLLMQAAITKAANKNKVLFITSSNFPKGNLSIHGMVKATPSVIKNIKVLHAITFSEIQQYLASIHLNPLEERPSVIILDDANYYCCRDDGVDSFNKLVLFTKLLSLILESIFFVCKNRHSEQVTDENGLLILSWNLTASGSNSNLIEEIAGRLANLECWKLNRNIGSDNDLSKQSFVLRRNNEDNEIIEMEFYIKLINEKLQQICLKDIYIEKDDDCEENN